MMVRTHQAIIVEGEAAWQLIAAIPEEGDGLTLL
jgi:hypothetical protein